MRVVQAVLAFATTLMLMVIPSAVSAEGGDILNPLTMQQQREIEGFLVEHGVTKQKSAELIRRFQQGEMWDSLNPEVVPVARTESRRGAFIQVVLEYPDGSIAVTTTSDLMAAQQLTLKSGDTSRGILPTSVYGCTYKTAGSYGGYWKYCTADVNLAVIRMGFKFDYQNIKELGSKITWYGDYFKHYVGASLSNFRFTRLSDTKVRLTADLDVAFKGFPLGWDAWMQANVSGNNAWTTHN